MKRRIEGKRVIFGGILTIVLYITNLFAAELRVSWQANTEPDLQGYKIYYGMSGKI